MGLGGLVVNSLPKKREGFFSAARLLRTEGRGADEIEGRIGSVCLPDRRSLPTSADEVQDGEGYDGQECGKNMAGESAQRGLARVRSVTMFPGAMGKGEDSRRNDKESASGSKKDAGPGGPIRRHHGEPGLFLVHRIRVPT